MSYITRSVKERKAEIKRADGSTFIVQEPIEAGVDKLIALAVSSAGKGAQMMSTKDMVVTYSMDQQEFYKLAKKTERIMEGK